MPDDTLLAPTAAPAADAPAATDAPPAPAAAADPVVDAAAAPAAEGAAPAAPEAAKPVVPETYEFKAPEGVEFDADVLGELTTFAKETGLTQEAAQKVADLGVKQMQKFRQTYEAHVAETVEGWKQASVSDKEFGGANLQANLAIAKQALETFATPEDRAFLAESGLGNHPAIIRMLYRAGKAISEDGFISGAKAPLGAKTADLETRAASKLYGNT